MKFFIEKIGDCDLKGERWPIFISLHGGGGCAPEKNDV